MIHSGEQLYDLVSATKIRLRRSSPFFSALALFAEIQFTDFVETAATDGKTLFFNPEAFSALDRKERDMLFLHVLMHAALLHALRRGPREHHLFNIAADIVVNGMIAAESGAELPDSWIRDPELEHLSVEEIYLVLERRAEPLQLLLPDLLRSGRMHGICNMEEATAAVATDHGAVSLSDVGAIKETDVDLHSFHPVDQHPSLCLDPAQVGLGCKDQQVLQPVISEPAAVPSIAFEYDLEELHQRSSLESFWKQAIQQAQVMAQRQSSADRPSGFDRHLLDISDARLDWRTLLWRYLVRTPNDYSGFDRRHIHRGIYIDQLEGESVQIYCCIDTSGSIASAEISGFLGELRGILASYPMLECQLWYADADCYGPYRLDRGDEIPRPMGGGGTDFRPFFEVVARIHDRQGEAVCVYLTDGYGSFPAEACELPVLWVISPGGLQNHQIPFGDVCRLI